MRFKLDENFGSRTAGLFRLRGHDVATVREQELAGCSDEGLFEVCAREDRCLVTLDLDFADVVRFPPAQSSGIAVIRLPRNPSLDLLGRLVAKMLSALDAESVLGRLWVVEVTRIRIHSDTSEGA
jgi:predicted nuclease of predicted toxin-antitoxin system